MVRNIKRAALTLGVIGLTILVSWWLYFLVGDAASLIGIFGGFVCFTIWDN